LDLLSSNYSTLPYKLTSNFRFTSLPKTAFLPYVWGTYGKFVVAALGKEMGSGVPILVISYGVVPVLVI
jgi:hypothetical protein